MKTIRYLKRHKIPYIFAINGGIARDNEPGWKKRLKKNTCPGRSFIFRRSPLFNYLTYYGVDPKKSAFTPTPPFSLPKSSRKRR
jgi:hypothetical protein